MKLLHRSSGCKTKIENSFNTGPLNDFCAFFSSACHSVMFWRLLSVARLRRKQPCGGGKLCRCLEGAEKETKPSQMLTVKKPPESSCLFENYTAVRSLLQPALIPRRSDKGTSLISN